MFAPATLQLSTATDCLVVHLAHLEAPWPAALVEVLASPETLMCGLGIDELRAAFKNAHGEEASKVQISVRRSPAVRLLTAISKSKKLKDFY